MSKLKRFLRNRNVIFLLALAASLLVPQAAPLTRHLVLPALALAMALSTMEIANNVFRRPRSLLFPALLGIIMSYVILGNIIIGLSALMIRDEMTWTGFVLLASVPPAIAVIPFSVFLRGNGLLSLIGTAGAYLGALVIMPLIALGLLSSAELDPFKLLMITLELIVLPLAVSRWLIQKGIKERIDPYRGAITNWSFFVVIYTLIALNRRPHPQSDDASPAYRLHRHHHHVHPRLPHRLGLKPLPHPERDPDQSRSPWHPQESGIGGRPRPHPLQSGSSPPVGDFHNSHDRLRDMAGFQETLGLKKRELRAPSWI